MFKHYVKRTVKKLFAFPLWIIFSIVHLICKPAAIILRFVTMPGTFIAVLIAAIVFFTEGFSPIIVQILLIALAQAIIYVISPYIPAWICRTKYKLKEIALRPIVIKPPVRYTVDFI